MPKVSVIVPIFRAEKYIERCATSLFQQTMDDIEFIFIDDCSPDSSMTIINSLLQYFPKRKEQIIIKRLSQNFGIANARRLGIELATGHYISFCDSDDWLESSAFETMYSIAEKQGTDVVVSDAYLASNKGGKKWIRRKEDYSSGTNAIKNMIRNGIWPCWGMICKRSIFIDNVFQYPQFDFGEDLVIMTQIYSYAHSMFHIQKPLYNYFENPTSVTRTMDIESCIKRVNHMKSNIDHILQMHDSKMIQPLGKNSIIALKVYGKTYAGPICHTREGRRIWNNLYPEIEKQNILLNPEIPLYHKFYYLCVRLNLVMVLRPIIHTIRRIVHRYY